MGEDFNFDAAPAAPTLSFGAEEPAAAQAQEAPKEEAAKEMKEQNAEANNTQKAVKKLKANLEKTTLGDISSLAALKSEMEKKEAAAASEATEE